MGVYMKKSELTVELSKEEIDELMKDLPNIIRQLQSDDAKEDGHRISKEDIEKKEKK